MMTTLAIVALALQDAVTLPDSAIGKLSPAAPAITARSPERLTKARARLRDVQDLLDQDFDKGVIDYGPYLEQMSQIMDAHRQILGALERYDDPATLLDLQQEMALEERVFTTVQNVMKTRRDTANKAIQNVR